MDGCVVLCHFLSGPRSGPGSSCGPIALDQTLEGILQDVQKHLYDSLFL